jgi:hypothetical protein
VCLHTGTLGVHHACLLIVRAGKAATPERNLPEDLLPYLVHPSPHRAPASGRSEAFSVWVFTSAPCIPIGIAAPATGQSALIEDGSRTRRPRIEGSSVKGPGRGSITWEPSRKRSGSNSSSGIVPQWRSSTFAARGSESSLFPLARVGPTTPKRFEAKLQTCPQLAVHAPPDSSLEVRAANREELS